MRTWNIQQVANALAFQHHRPPAGVPIGRCHMCGSLTRTSAQPTSARFLLVMTLMRECENGHGPRVFIHHGPSSCTAQTCSNPLSFDRSNLERAVGPSALISKDAQAVGSQSSKTLPTVLSGPVCKIACYMYHRSSSDCVFSSGHRSRLESPYSVRLGSSRSSTE